MRDAPTGAQTPDASRRADRRTLATALAINLAMFVVGLVGWRLAHSTALLGDALDMLADASGYAVSWLAVGASARRQRAAARWNGVMLMALGLGVLAEVARRWTGSDEPRGAWIMAFAGLSLLANGIVLGMLRKYRDAPQVHLRAAWVDTRADVLVNAGVLVSGALVAFTGYRVIDLIAGAILAGFVLHEGWELWEAGDATASP
jgi:cation diffusion facilitator family transporter